MTTSLTQFRPNHNPAFDVASTVYDHGDSSPYIMLTLSSASAFKKLPDHVIQVTMTEAQAETVIAELVGWRGKYSRADRDGAR